MNHQQWLEGLDWEPVDPDQFEKLSRDEKLMRIRHSCAHVMAGALQRLQAETQFATGPATAQGFFYDVKTEKSIAKEDLDTLSKTMEDIVKEKQPIEYTIVKSNDARDYFTSVNQSYKLEIIDKINEEEVSLYRNGDFIDLCAGPHVPHTGYCQNFKLLNVSSAHWKDETYPSLLRLSGTAWDDKKALKQYLRFLEEAKARDHRVLGPQLDLFSFHPWASAALWHPKGVMLRNQLFNLWNDLQEKYGFVEISNPVLYRKELFECSGHWEHFQEDMFTIPDANGEPEFVLKPMNCPDTMLFFKEKSRSYRDLPMRVAESQILHRNESTGTLNGIMRTRCFQQDDAHLFIAPEHLKDEVISQIEMMDYVYRLFNLDYHLSLSTRPESFLGEIEVWNQAEEDLKAVLDGIDKDYIIEEGEGAFYGPKIDIHVNDSLGREWQCATIQLDFQLPRRFELKYTDSDGEQKTPIVLHRAVFGSLDRFLGVLIEHLNGSFPTWLAPIQTMVLPIGQDHVDYAYDIRGRLKQEGIRCEVESDGSVNYRIRAAEKQKIPFMLVVGNEEIANKTVSIRKHKSKQLTSSSIDEFCASLQEKIKTREFDVELKTLDKPLSEITTQGTEEKEY